MTRKTSSRGVKELPPQLRTRNRPSPPAAAAPAPVTLAKPRKGAPHDDPAAFIARMMETYPPDKRPWMWSTCKYCGEKTFRGGKRSADYCSNACKQAAYRERHRTPLFDRAKSRQGGGK